MNGEVKLMKMLDSSKKKLRDGMIEEFSRESSMLVNMFFCIGLVSDFLQENYSKNGKDLLLLWRYIVQVPLKLSHSKMILHKW